MTARRSLWEPSSTRCLDAVVSLLLDYRVRVSADSPYAHSGLEAILVHEVYPVCRSNLAAHRR